MMKRLTFTVASLAFASHALAQPAIIQSPAYKECIALSNTNPPQALTKAEEWLAVDNSVSAYHCRGMALYGLKRYPEAAQALEEVRKIIPLDNMPLRSFVTKQAAQAWKSANRADAALAILSTQIDDLSQARGNNALNAKLTSDLLVERARMNVTYGKVSVATRDLDHAISLTPLNTDALIERASAFELLNDYPLARADIEAALTIDPNNQKARAVLSRLDQKPATAN